MTRGWNRDPSAAAAGTERSGVSAALWTSKELDTQEVSAAASSFHHVSIALAPCSRETLILDGRRVFDSDVEAGEICLVRAGEEPRAVLHGPHSFLHVYLPEALVRDLAHSAGFGGAVPELINPLRQRDPVIERIGREVLEEIRSAQPLSRLRIDLLGLDLAIQMLRQHSTAAGLPHLPRHAPGSGGLASWQVRRICDYLAADLAADPGLPELAALVGLSPAHVCRAFKVSTGVPPHAWLIAKRVERACELLDKTSLPVEEVAAQVGYADPSHFARMFRKAHAVSPSRYRRGRRS